MLDLDALDEDVADAIVARQRGGDWAATVPAVTSRAAETIAAANENGVMVCSSMAPSVGGRHPGQRVRAVTNRI